MKYDLYLSIVIPCYNEAANLENGRLTEVFDYLKKAGFTWEVIISDDGSTDHSRELVKKQIAGQPRAALLENVHGGKPMAILAGIQKARGRYVLFTDMDQSTPLTELDKLLPYFDQYDVIIGSRQERKDFPMYRKIGSLVFRLIRQALILRRIADTQCGFKALQTDLAADLFPKLQFFQNQAAVSGWKVGAFDVELLYLAEVGGRLIKEVPVEWADRDQSCNKEKSYFKEAGEMLAEIFKVKYNGMRGVYNKK